MRYSYIWSKFWKRSQYAAKHVGALAGSLMLACNASSTLPSSENKVDPAANEGPVNYCRATIPARHAEEGPQETRFLWLEEMGRWVGAPPIWEAFQGMNLQIGEARDANDVLFTQARYLFEGVEEAWQISPLDKTRAKFVVTRLEETTEPSKTRYDIALRITLDDGQQGTSVVVFRGQFLSYESYGNLRGDIVPFVPTGSANTCSIE